MTPFTNHSGSSVPSETEDKDILFTGDGTMESPFMEITSNVNCLTEKVTSETSSSDPDYNGSSARPLHPCYHDPIRPTLGPERCTLTKKISTTCSSHCHQEGKVMRIR